MLQARPAWTRCSISTRRCLFRRAAQHYSTVSPPRIVQLLHPDAAAPPIPSGASLTVNGFVRSVRKQKRVAFAAIGDGSTLKPLQAVLTPDQAEGLSNGIAVKLTGNWVPSPAGKEQTHELHVQNVKILGDNDAATYPIQKKYQTPEYLRTLPHLRSRVPINSLLLRLRSEVIGYATSFFSQQGFVQTHPPIITSSDCEGGGEVFEIGKEPVQQLTTNGPPEHVADASYFFRNPKYLTVSSQLHLEALAQSVGNVWTLSPTFRAEQSDTPRHLSEFYMLEAEICFVEELGTIMDVVEALVRNIGKHVRDSNLGSELLSSAGTPHELGEHEHISRHQLEARWKALVDQPWPRITYHEAVKTLQVAVSRGEVSFNFRPAVGAGLQSEHEKYLATLVGNGSPVFVTDYPRDIKAFYMALSSGAASPVPTVACFDLLVPEICELVGGSMREHRLQDLLNNMAIHGLMTLRPQGPKQNTSGSETMFSDVVQAGAPLAGVPSNLQWYVDLRRYGSVPHGGFGVGFDRLLCYLAGLSSIRDVVAFPRWYGRCDC